MKKRVTCPDCKGTGNAKPTKAGATVFCSTCRGTGELWK